MDALAWLRKQLETDDNDLLREMVRSFAESSTTSPTSVSPMPLITSIGPPLRS
jgi:hypothetical protein